jgi:hypothetical protein
MVDPNDWLQKNMPPIGQKADRMGRLRGDSVTEVPGLDDGPIAAAELE